MAGDVIVGDASHRRVRPIGSSAFANPKSSTFTVPSGAHLDVRGLQIAMDDALLVRGFERFRDLLRDRKCFIHRIGPLRDPVSERRAFDQLHDESARPFDSSRP